MLPSFAINDVGHGTLADAIFISQLLLLCFTSAVATANVTDIGFADFGTAMSGPFYLVAFPPHVSQIVELGTEEKMFRVDALGVVTTGAIMKNAEAIRYWPANQNPGDAMGAGLPMRMISINTVATPGVCSPVPQPARFGFGHFRPKSFGQWATRVG